MADWLARAGGIATLGFAGYHVFIPRFMDWATDLESLSIGNRKIVRAFNVATIYLLLAMGLLSIAAAPRG